MGVAKPSSLKNTGKPAARPKARAAAPQEKAARKAAASSRARVPEPELAPVLEERARRDIAGISFIVLGVAFLLVALIPGSAVVTTALSTVVKLLIGVGSYLLPLLLFVVGTCFLVRIDNGRVPARLAIGLGIIFFALLVILSLFTPYLATDGAVPSLMFDESQLKARGGYLGAGIAWAGLNFLGFPVSLVIMVGVVLIGLAVIGLSASRLIERVCEKGRSLRRGDDDDAAVPAAPFATARMAASSVEGEPTRALDRPSADAVREQTVTAPDSRALLEQALGSRRSSASGRASTGALTRRLGQAESQPAATKPLAKRPSAPGSVSGPKPQDGFELPAMDLLKVSKKTKKSQAFAAELADTAARLQRTLEDFGIMATVVDWIAGPTVTLFEVDLPAGVRVNRITNLGDDIALALAAPGVRIFAPIPGTHYVGIEVPNITRENVLLGDILKEAKGGPLEVAIGKDVEGRPIVSDLAKMPHLLIGGTTGSGKSVGINSMIMSMLMRATPSEVRFIMIDPKRVEFTPYNGIPHLYVPVVTEPKEAASALSWGVAEMERRLKVFSKVGARNIGQYNDKVQSGQVDAEEFEELPYIVIIIDELADLMMNVGKEVEFSISRIAQLARAAGIHLIVATQRPSANVVTGLIKANITNRMSFNVASGLDSRVILDTAGAESLIGNGDLLLSKPEFAKPVRIQGCYVGEDEIASVVEAIKAQGEPEYHNDILKTNLITLGASQPDGSGGSAEDDDPLIWDAAEIVVATGMGSTSNIQRKLKVGYSRAGRIMDMLEEKGVVGPANGSKPRDVLVDAMELETLKAFEQND